MKFWKKIIFLAVLAVTVVVGLPRQGLAQPATDLRILSPKNEEKISTDFVELRYELVNSCVPASSSPTYQLQLDNTSPVQTTGRAYTFSGLPPGSHMATIQAVDANGTPIAQSANIVRFVVLAETPPHGTGSNANASWEHPQTQDRAEKNALPDTGGALPLVSIIGFGVLVGGIASALKTR